MNESTPRPFQPLVVLQIARSHGMMALEAMDVDAVTLGPFLKEARLERGMTQEQLAQRLHVSSAAVSKWERGKSLPDIAKVEELADALDLSVLELMRCQRQEQPLPKQELAEVYAQTLQTARHQSRRRMLKVGIAAVLTACLLLAAHYVPLDHLFRVWKMNYHTTGEAAALFTVGSREDRRTAQPIMDLAEEAFSSIGLTKTQARSAYGKLSQYTYCTDVYKDVVAERHTLELLSAHFTSDQGLIWVYYTQEGLDESGEVITGSFRVESLWKAARGKSGQWKIYDIKEHP